MVNMVEVLCKIILVSDFLTTMADVVMVISQKVLVIKVMLLTLASKVMFVFLSRLCY